MKNVLIGAGDYYFSSSVPDIVAKNLEQYCITFYSKWIVNAPEAKKYRKYDKNNNVIYHYDIPDFIEYLNTYLFKNEPSSIVEEVGEVEDFILEKKYKNYPVFNF